MPLTVVDRHIEVEWLVRTAEFNHSSIGDKPVLLYSSQTFGTGKIDDEQLLELVKQHFELRPAGIIHAFKLQNLPSERSGRFYQDVAAYGHFGRTDLELPWEQTDKAAILSQALTQSLTV